MQGMTTFDFVTAHVVVFLMCFYVYKETPFKSDIDTAVRIYLDAFLQKAKLFFETVAGLNAFLLLDYEDYNGRLNDSTAVEKVEDEKPMEKNEVKYEDKYLEQFKAFPNEYFFSEEEKATINYNVEIRRVDEENKIRANMEQVMEKIDHMEFIIKKGIDDEESINDLFSYYNLDYDEYKTDPDFFKHNYIEFTTIEKLYDDILHEKHALESELDKLKAHNIDIEKLNEEARHEVMKTKLRNCYVMDYTPLGNVVMRYDGVRGTFEYFSNNTIPYRYLEPIGRKYVMTFFCKPLFVDLEEELKRAEEKYDAEEEERKERAKRNETKQVFSSLKSYNKPLLKTTPINLPGKNRESQKFALPPQIKANLPNVNATSQTDKHLLKENANRYTWEGRFSNWIILKKIDRKQIDKKYAMTFADFKKMQAK